jgi:alpha-mannosidase
MRFEDLMVILPGYSIESFPVEIEDEEADQYLSAWTALFHPVLLAHSAVAPRPVCACSLPESPANSLIVVPACCDASLTAEWLERAESVQARLVRHECTREAMLAAALSGLPAPERPIDPELIDEFFAVGMCYFVVELHTRRTRYMSNLDAERFGRHVLEAGVQAYQGDAVAAREQLQGAFDRLVEAREYAFPTHPYLLDLTLVAPTTLGEPLREELRSPHHVNLLLSGESLDAMARREPATLELLREKLERKELTFAGGEQDELETPLLPIECILANLLQGLDSYRRHLGQAPTLFGRRRFGLTPILPQILQKTGFSGALHFTLDDGVFPTASQSKNRWLGVDASDMESLTRVPLDARRASVFLRLLERLGQLADVDYATTVAIAHWPGEYSPWFTGLRNIAARSNALGRLAGLGEYFDSTHYSGQSISRRADEYRSPYLRQEVTEAGAGDSRRDPISRWVRRHRNQAAAETIAALNTLAAMIVGHPVEPKETEARIEATGSTSAGATPEDELAGQLESAAARCSEAMVGANPSGPQGVLILNPTLGRRRVLVEIPGQGDMPGLAGPVVISSDAIDAEPGNSSRPRQVVADAPAMGFAWIGPAANASSAKPAKGRGELAVLVEENTLRNEFMQVSVHPTTGAIQSVQNYGVRANRLAQQIAMRTLKPGDAKRRGVDPGCEEAYSIMAADQITVVEQGPIVGRIEVRGRIVSREGDVLANYVQATQLQRGSRVLQIEIDLDVLREPKADPWGSYYAARFAWTDDAAELSHGVGLTNEKCEGEFLDSPYYFDIQAEKVRHTLLFGGLPYHRRFGKRKLDTLLVVHGETARSFRLGVGVDLKQCGPAAAEFVAPRRELLVRSQQPPQLEGWLFHATAKNVVATHWEPMAADGRLLGFRARILETEGRRSTFTLQTFRPVAVARETDYLGQTITELASHDDQITIGINPHEWIQIEAEFAGKEAKEG